MPMAHEIRLPPFCESRPKANFCPGFTCTCEGMDPATSVKVEPLTAVNVPIGAMRKVVKLGIAPTCLGSFASLATRSRSPAGPALETLRLTGSDPFEAKGDPATGVRVPSELIAMEAIVLLLPLTANRKVPAAFTASWESDVKAFAVELVRTLTPVPPVRKGEPAT